MTKKEKETIAKKTFYEFKKFARQHGFFEEYKKFCEPVAQGKKFIDVVREVEPVKLIQNQEAFCIWPYDSGIKWQEMSNEWARHCLENHLYYSEKNALKYVYRWISTDIARFFNANLLDLDEFRTFV